jgi:hypothetical protein
MLTASASPPGTNGSLIYVDHAPIRNGTITTQRHRLEGAEINPHWRSRRIAAYESIRVPICIHIKKTSAAGMFQQDY